MNSRYLIDRPFALNTSITCRAAFSESLRVVDWSAILIDLWKALGYTGGASRMKIVVIGGSGFIETKLVKRLREAGHEIIAASPKIGR
jgi:hypothetical protein